MKLPLVAKPTSLADKGAHEDKQEKEREILKPHPSSERTSVKAAKR